MSLKTDRDPNQIRLDLENPMGNYQFQLGALNMAESIEDTLYSISRLLKDNKMDVDARNAIIRADLDKIFALIPDSIEALKIQELSFQRGGSEPREDPVTWNEEDLKAFVNRYRKSVPRRI